jgi:hypothetical protein
MKDNLTYLSFGHLPSPKEREEPPALFLSEDDFSSHILNISINAKIQSKESCSFYQMTATPLALGRLVLAMAL